LIDRLCGCLAEASNDTDHPAVRYGHQLEALRKKLSGLSDSVCHGIAPDHSLMIWQTNASSPAGGHTVPLPPMNAHPRSGREGGTNGRSENHSSVNGSNSFTGESQPWLAPGHNGTGNGISTNNTPPSWTFPIPSGQNQPFPFSYPNTPVPMGGLGSTNMPYVAPPLLQPLSEVSNLHPQEMAVNNLGFATLDDWFGPSNLEQGNDDNTAVFGGLDLQDFWMKVGPGEVSDLLSDQSDVIVGSRRVSLPMTTQYHATACMSILLGPLSKYSRANSNTATPFLDRLLKVCTHSHT